MPGRILGHGWPSIPWLVVVFAKVDAIGGARFDDGAGGDNEVQRTMLEIVNQLDGFDSRGNIKVRNGTRTLVELRAPSRGARARVEACDPACLLGAWQHGDSGRVVDPFC
jgi:hypothetical protein